ncbi:GH92 family glycosyl hydrolase [Herbiconiux sp. 11R-BC]|uniref:GH92 family glycosyl hydrolase n=1 Tax=Herbiconiux sp. 11R-BC TaxID=3111637 RepID=UPI003C0D3DD5
MSALRVVPGAGPDAAPAAARSGLFGDEPLRYELPGGGAVSARAVLAEQAPTPVAGLELRYAVLPVFDADAEEIADGFRASAVAVDVLFDDGSRLLDGATSAGTVLDQYGLPADAAGSFAGHAIAPDQWNLRRITFGADDPRVAVALELVARTPEPSGSVGALLEGWLDGVGLVPRVGLDRSRPLAELVDTRRGTHSSPWLSRGNTAPFVAVPHGGVFATPMTDVSNPHWNYTWNKHGETHRPALQALAVSHSASIWVGDWGVVQFMPGAGAPVGDPAARAAGFDHARETAHPHRYRVELDGGLTAEATAGDHSVVLRFGFPAGGGWVVVDCLAGGEFHYDHAAGVLTGWVDGSSVHGHEIPRVFVHVTVEGDAGPDAEHDGGPVGDPVLACEQPADSPDDSPRRVLRFAAGVREVTLRVGTSLISTEVARLAAERETAGGLEAVARAARERWDALLGRVRVEGATDDQLVTLASNLYRMFLYPNRLGELLPDGTEAHASTAVTAAPVHTAAHTGLPVLPGPLSANNGFWDTYRTIWPALLLLEPDGAGELLDGFVQHYREGGWVPRWSAPGYLDAMVGTSFDIVAADAAMKRTPGLELREAYLAALRDATALPESAAVGRKGQAESLFRGRMGRGVPEGLSWTLESALNDYGLFVLAGLVDAPAERRYFASRALAHEELFDRGTGFFRGASAEHPDAEPFDPRVWGGDYTETNAYGMAFSAPHDGAGLAALHGGRDALRAHLDGFFATPETAREAFRGEYPTVIHEMTEARDLRLGMWGLSNQPAHHIPFMYAFAGAPWRLQAIVREALARLFTGSEIGQGYPGDEDNGEMSAWWFFAALGLYPLVPGSGEYVLGSPLFPRMSVDAPRGGVIEVIAHGQAPGSPYVQSVLVDGEPWPSLALPHERIAAGAVIEFTLGPEPSLWGSGPDAEPASLGGVMRQEGFARLQDAVVGSDRPALADDLAAASVELAPGEAAVFELAPGSPAVLYTLTGDAPGIGAWALESSDDGVHWAVLDERAGEIWLWPGQLRPFEIASPRSARLVRLRALAPLVLRQFEALRPRA